MRDCWVYDAYMFYKDSDLENLWLLEYMINQNIRIKYINWFYPDLRKSFVIIWIDSHVFPFFPLILNQSLMYFRGPWEVLQCK